MLSLKKKVVVSVVVGLSFIGASIAQASAPTQIILPFEVQKIPSVPAILSRIAVCESGGQQFVKGEVVIGKATGDIGKWQINPIHLANAKKKGIDIYSLKGNTDYALYLYSQNGTRDWNSSRGCWGAPAKAA